jgi:hypothetical protein
MRTYHCDDGNAELEIEAESPESAAQEYVDEGDWGSADSTMWINVRVWEEDDDGLETKNHGWIMITIDPDEPDCTHDDGHDWQSPYDIVGGIKENSGVWGHGGGVIIEEVCMYCGCARETDTWAQDSDTGVQGLRSVKYEQDKYKNRIES